MDGIVQFSVNVTYTLPKHSKPSSMPAQEIERGGCVNGDAILKKYSAEDIKYDKRTKHGKTESASLQ